MDRGFSQADVVKEFTYTYAGGVVLPMQPCSCVARWEGDHLTFWAMFAVAVLTGKPITIYGDGGQVRDVLFVEDLIDAYLAAIDRIDDVAGQVFNIGGGPEYSLAVWSEFGPMLERLFMREIPVTYEDWRPGDQKVFISNIDKARRQLEWSPKVSPEVGIPMMASWIRENQSYFY